jgi:hypothetical protein
MIGGGSFNITCGTESIIGGGKYNTATGCNSVIGGGGGNCTGLGNRTFSNFSGILGGFTNSVLHDCSFIIGQGITTCCTNTTYVNCLNIKDLPTEAGLPLPSGTLYRCTVGNGIYIA